MEKLNVLINEAELEERLQEMADQIMEDYKGRELVFVCVLKGAVFFTIDLARKIKNDIHLEFVKISSYGSGTESSGKINLELDIKGDIEGKDVIILEDIVDTGYTVEYLLKHLGKKNPRTMKVATLLDKKERREVQFPVDYTGFDIPNKFVIGYGLDYDEKYRFLPYVGYIE